MIFMSLFPLAVFLGSTLDRYARFAVNLKNRPVSWTLYMFLRPYLTAQGSPTRQFTSDTRQKVGHQPWFLALPFTIKYGTKKHRQRQRNWPVLQATPAPETDVAVSSKVEEYIKDRIPFCVCVSADGSRKVPMSATGRAKNPRCFN